MDKQFSYEGLSVERCVKHLAKFASDIWQIHPFCEGNTRATAVFIIKYMKTFGFKVNNDAFEKNSWYFRNALVRANYNDLQNGVHATTKFLEMFFSNLILGTEYELKNRYMHVDYVDDNSQSVTPKAPKSQFDTLEGTLEGNAAKAIVEVGGANRVFACASHGVLSGPALERLEASCIEELALLNTIPESMGEGCSKIKYLSVAPMFAEAIERIYQEISIAKLFN